MRRLELTDLEKKYKGRIAVQRTDLCLESGVYGLLGENGAGKTTLMRMICGILKPTSGAVLCDGLEIGQMGREYRGLLGENGAGKTTLMRMICGILKPTSGAVLCDGLEIGQMGREYRGLLGYLPQSMGYYGDFSAWRFLRYLAALKAIPENRAESRMRELLELVDLYPYRKQKLKTYSGGMLRRIGIAQALLNDPEILILDEPTAGLDPGERVRFRNIISSLGKNRIVVLSTHIVPDVEYIADQIMIMQNGRIIQKGTEQRLAGLGKGIVWKCVVPEERAEEFSRKFVVSNLRRLGNEVELRIVSEKKPAEDSVEEEAVLEDIYLYLTRQKQEGPHETF